MSDLNHPVEIWPINKITPYEKNAKIHDESQVEKLATSIKTYGWTQPIVVDKDGVIIIGHGRRLAAISLGFDKIPVVCRRDLTKAQADGLRLADNRVTSTEYDMASLQEELRRLGVGGEIDMSTLGFDEKEIDFSIADLGDINPDFFVDDISSAVEEQKEQNARKAEEVDDVAAPVADALGFKRITIAQSRTLRDLMNGIEMKTGKKGIDALLEVLSRAQ